MKFTIRRRKLLLKNLVKFNGCIVDACDQTGISKETFYEHCRKDPEWKRIAYDTIERIFEDRNVEMRETSKTLLEKSAEILKTQADENPDELDHRAVGIISKRLDENTGVVGTGASKITTETKTSDGTITKITLVGIGVPQLSQVDSDDIGSGEEDE